MHRVLLNKNVQTPLELSKMCEKFKKTNKSPATWSEHGVEMETIGCDYELLMLLLFNLISFFFFF